MAHFTYRCPDCENFKVSLDKRLPEIPCPKCGKPCKPVLRCGTVRLVDVLDNGAMVRKVERLAGVEEMMEERDRISQERAKQHVDNSED